MIKVAFCFLLYDKLEHNCIWDYFFCGANPRKYSLYSHFKTVNSKSPKWLTKHRVKPVKTGWCGEGLINAFSKMITEALKDPQNKYICLISGTDIPLYRFSKTYEIITSFQKSHLSYPSRGTIFDDDSQLYSGHQWVILKRNIARAYRRLSYPTDQKAKLFLSKIRKMYRDHKVNISKGKMTYDKSGGWLGGCPDEVYPINWLLYLYGPKKLKMLLDNKETTYTYWDYKKDPNHPLILDVKTAKKKRKHIIKSGALFARKFTPEAAEYMALN